MSMWPDPRACLVMHEIRGGGQISPTAAAEDMLPLLVVGLDPGASSAFVAVEVKGLSSLEVAAFGRVPLNFSTGESAGELFGNAWALEWSKHGNNASSLQSLLCGHVHQRLVVIQQQRWYLWEHLFDATVALCKEQGYPIKVLPPSERFHRLGVSKDKAQTITAASAHAVGCPELQACLWGGVDGAHDFADAFLLVVMALQETRSRPYVLLVLLRLGAEL